MESNYFDNMDSNTENYKHTTTNEMNTTKQIEKNIKTTVE